MAASRRRRPDRALSQRRRLALLAGEPPPNQQPGIAVLPFATQSGEPKDERFADGLTEDLIIELARYRYLFVIARSSVIPYKGRATDVRQIGRELGVRYVFQGSLDGAADSVRVTAQLVDATNSSQIWSERYDRPLADLFSLRDDIVQHITGALISTLNRADAELARRKPPASLQAYDFYAIGRDLFRSDGVTKENMAKARSYFEKALAIDPQFSRAWYLLGWTHFNDAHLGWADDQARSWALFHEAARRAVVADPADATAQTLAGVSHFRLREFEAGELAWQLALRFGPHDYSTLRDTGCMFAMVFGTERAAEGLEITKRALRLNPMHPPGSSTVSAPPPTSPADTRTPWRHSSMPMERLSKTKFFWPWPTPSLGVHAKQQPSLPGFLKDARLFG